jgi:hypothetical protein
VKRTERNTPRVANFCEFAWKITDKRKFLAEKSQVKMEGQNLQKKWSGEFAMFYL